MTLLHNFLLGLILRFHIGHEKDGHDMTDVKVADGTVLQKKIEGSVTESSSANSGSWRLLKQESTGRFLGSIRIGEILLLDV